MNTSAPLVSVIVPAYNAARFLRESIQSVIDQTYQSWEIVIVNDGSTDDTENIIARIKSQHPGRIFSFSKPNGGQASARNLGIKHARGKYIAFLDADDIWLEDKLKTQIMLLEERGVDVCYSDAELFVEAGKDGRKHSDTTKFFEGDVLVPLLKGNFVVNSSVLVKKTAMEKAGPQREGSFYRNIEDYEYWIRLALFGFRFCYVNAPLVKYRIHPMQSSRNIRNGLWRLVLLYLCLLCDWKMWQKNVVVLSASMALRNLKSLMTNKT